MPVSPIFSFMRPETEIAADTAAGSVSWNPGPEKGWPGFQSCLGWKPDKTGSKYIQETDIIKGSLSSAASFQ